MKLRGSRRIVRALIAVQNTSDDKAFDTRLELIRRRFAFVFFGLSLLLVVALFAMAPAPGNVYFGEDWSIFRGAALRLAHGYTEIYDVDYPPEYAYIFPYFNPPWLALALVPVAVLPERIGWALLCVTTLGLTIALLQRWTEDNAGRLKIGLALISPAVVQVIIHGQIDALIVACVFLPAQWWPLVISIKPQDAAGLLFGIPRALWLRAFLIFGIVMVLSLLIFGLWPVTVHDTLFGVERGDNLWVNTWPFSGAVGVGLVILGIYRKDERILAGASPLLSPYALPHTLYGSWVALVSYANRPQAVILWLVYWGLTLAPII